MDFLKQIKILPRWVIASLDALILFQSAFFAYLVRFNFELELVEQNNAFLGSLVFMIFGVIVMLMTRSYQGIVRHTGFRDSIIIFRTIMFNFLLVAVSNFIYEKL